MKEEELLNRLLHQVDYLAEAHQLDVSITKQYIEDLGQDELEKRFIGERLAALSTTNSFNDEELLDKRTIQRMVIRIGWELDKK